MWPGLVAAMKEGGADAIETYVFWNGHEISPGESHMKSFTTYVVDMMKREKFFISQGGHIILTLIENEYGDNERVYGSGGKPYAMWAASMALSQNTEVPWIMCQQYDAPDPVINTCNSFYCDQFTPNSPNKPKRWTENWSGWFD